MPPACELLEWDTAFFGFRVARVCGHDLSPSKLAQIDGWCKRQRIRCLYLLACADDPETTRLAEESGFHLADVRISLACRLPLGELWERIAVAPMVTFCAARPSDVQQLRVIARESHGGTRFYYDGNFPRGLAARLYETWITKSCEGYADIVLVASSEEMPVGYVSCHLERNDSTGSIGLVAVSRHARGNGIGRTLVLAALRWFEEQGVGTVRVVTQARNCEAQRLYQRCGFVTDSVHLWYHKWYEPQDGMLG